MALNNLGLGFVFTARNLATGTINRVKGKLAGLGAQSRLTGIAVKGGLAAAAGGIVSLTAGLVSLGAAFSFAEAAGNFEQQMRLVGELAGVETPEQMKRLRDSAIEAGLATKFSPDEAVEGLKNLITAGLSAEQAMRTLTPALQVATFGQISVDEASRAVVGSLAAFRRQGLDAQETADRLATAMARTNFQASDFDVGLAALSATAGTFNQSLDDTLVGLGLLRNMNIGASRAATALRESIRRVASDSAVMNKIQKLNVDIFDESGERMRSIIDIMFDVKAAIQDLEPAQRQQAITSIFGARGLQAFAAVTEGSIEVMRDGRRVMLEGAEAVDELRRAMAESAGQADELQRAVAEGNFAGVKEVLKGVASTLMVEIGKPLGEVLLPILQALRDGLTSITRFVKDLPDPVKRFGAALLVLGGVGLTAAGAFGILTGLIVIAIPFLKLIALTMLGLAAAMAPFIAAVAAGGLAILAFRELINRNIGGVGDFFREAFNKVKLAFQGLMQLFSEGSISGPLADELLKAENEGVLKFISTVFRIGSRVMAFFEGIKAGFNAAVAALGPVVGEMLDAFKGLGEAFGFTSDAAEGLADTPMNDFARTGVKVGRVIGDILRVVIRGITFAVDLMAGWITGVREAFQVFEPVFNRIGQLFVEIGAELAELFRTLGVSTKDGENNTKSFGEVLGNIFGGIIGIIAGFVGFVLEGVKITVAALNKIDDVVLANKIAFQNLGTSIKTIFLNVVDTVKIAIDQLIGLVGGIAGRIPARFRPEFLNDIVSEGEAANRRVEARRAGIAARTAAANTVTAARSNIPQAAAAVERINALTRRTVTDAMTQALEAQRAEARRDRLAAMQTPIQIDLSLDGEPMGRAIASANRSAADANFTPGVPAEAL